MADFPPRLVFQLPLKPIFQAQARVIQSEAKNLRLMPQGDSKPTFYYQILRFALNDKRLVFIKNLGKIVHFELPKHHP